MLRFDLMLSVVISSLVLFANIEPVVTPKATFEETMVSQMAELSAWEQAKIYADGLPGLAQGTCYAVGPLTPKDPEVMKMISSSMNKFDFSKPLRIGAKDYIWREVKELSQKAKVHDLSTISGFEKGKAYLIVWILNKVDDGDSSRREYKYAITTEKDAYSEWRPGRNRRDEEDVFPFYTFAKTIPLQETENQLVLFVNPNEDGRIRVWLDFVYLKAGTGGTWVKGNRRRNRIVKASSFFRDPVSQYRIGWQMQSNLWIHATQPYSYAFEFVPGYEKEFFEIIFPKDFEKRCFSSDIEQLRASLKNAVLAVDDLESTFGKDYPNADLYRQKIKNLIERTAVLKSESDIKKGIAELLAIDEERRKIMLDNPVLNAYPLIMGKGAVHFNANWEGPNQIGNNLVLWDPAHPEKGDKPLTKAKQVASFDIHWNADKILYSDKHHLIEHTLANGEERIITKTADKEINHYDACYLPNGRICSACNACWQAVPCVASPNVGNLHLMDADGSNERRITFDQDHNWNPVVTEDGRVLFTRWEYADTPHYFTRLIMRMNPDGTAQMEYYGSNSYWPNSLFWPIPIPGKPHQFVAIVTGHHYANRMGIPYIFDTQKGRFEEKGVVQELGAKDKKVEPTIKDRLVEGIWPMYAAPYPLSVGKENKGSGTYFLISRKKTASSGWELCLMDRFDNVTVIRPTEFENGKEVSWMNARPLVRKTVPRVIPDRVDVASTNATIYLVDIYKGEGLKGFPRGSIKKLRIGTYTYRHFGNGFTYAAAYEGGWDIKRIIGEVDVTPNGSAFFSVPANTPIFVQPLDAEGKAQALMRSWYNTMPGEIGSCVGCHESQNTTPPTEINDLTRLPPQVPVPFYGGERAYSFEREVQPILNRRCVGCHDEKAEKEKGRPDFRDKRLRPPEKELPRGCRWWHWLASSNKHLKKEGDHFSPAYLRLQRYVRRAGLEADYHILPPAEFEADTSYLVQLLKLGHYGVELNEEEWRKLYTWIDFNVPYYATYSESSMPPDPVNIAKRVKYDKLYSNKDNHEEDPVPVPPIEKFVPPSKKAVKTDVVKTIEIPNGYKVEYKDVALPSGKKMRFVKVPAQKPYWLGECEVSNEEYAEYDPKHDSRYAEGRDKDRVTRGYPLNYPNQPVCRVSWNDANGFCKWLSEKTGLKCSLPSEEEWSFAATAQGGTVNMAGTELERWNYGRCEKGYSDGVLWSAPVKSGEANKLGLKHILGNVCEWTASEFAPGLKTVKGGSWSDTRRFVNPDWKWRYAPYKVIYNVGFRVKIEE
jgi:hypothetical protein